MDFDDIWPDITIIFTKHGSFHRNWWSLMWSVHSSNSPRIQHKLIFVCISRMRLKHFAVWSNFTWLVIIRSFQWCIKNSKGQCHLKKGNFKKRARGVDFFGGIQGHSKRAPIVLNNFSPMGHIHRITTGHKCHKKEKIRALIFGLKYTKYLEGHQGHFRGHQRPWLRWPWINSRPVFVFKFPPLPPPPPWK